MKMTLERVRYRNSYSIEYGKMSDHIISTLSSEYNFGTMAYEDKWDYARSWHLHDYSYTELKPEYFSNSLLHFSHPYIYI